MVMKLFKQTLSLSKNQSAIQGTLWNYLHKGTQRSFANKYFFGGNEEVNTSFTQVNIINYAQ